MANVPYRDWFFSIEKFIPSGAKCAELFAGPGNFSGYVRTSGRKIITLDKEVSFCPDVCADAVALPFEKESFHALFATNASVNYLKDIFVLSRHFKECARCLQKEGVYIFDVCPPERAHALSGRTQVALEGKVKIMHRYESAYLYSLVTLESNLHRTEKHIQRIFTPAEILSAAKEANFLIEEELLNYGLYHKNNTTPIVAYVLRKNAKEAPK